VILLILALFFLLSADCGTASASDPSDIYQAIVDLHHRELLEKMGGSGQAKKESAPAAPIQKRRSPRPEKKTPSRRLVAIYGDRALLRIGGADLLVRRGSRVSDAGQSFRVVEIRRRQVVLVPGDRAVRFLRMAGPAGLFRFRGRTIVRGVGDQLGAFRVVELGMDHALLKNGPETKRLVPGEKPRPRPALILSFSGTSSGSLASTDFPKVPFSVRSVSGRHALLSFGSEEVEAGIGSTFGRWKIAGIDPASGVDVLDRLTGTHLLLGGGGGGGPPGSQGPPSPAGASPFGTGIANPGAFSPGVPGSGVPGVPPGPGTFPSPPGGMTRGGLPGAGLGFPGGGAPGNSGPFAQPPGGPQLPYNGY